MSWINLSDGFAWRSVHSGIDWICWVPGRKTEEGEIAWGEAGINRRIQGSLVKSDESLHQEVMEKALPLMKREVGRRNVIASHAELSDRIFDALGANAAKARAFAKSALNRDPESLVNFFRHHLTSYDADLRNGEDRYTATVRANTTLMEILEVYRSFKAEILSIKDFPPYFEAHVRLASLPHAAIRQAALNQIKQRRAYV